MYSVSQAERSVIIRTQSSLARPIVKCYSVPPLPPRSAEPRTRESQPVIRLYDTLTGDVRALAQRDEGKISLYACGPTVDDHPHLGHARQAMTYDVMRRYFEWQGLEVHHAANVTDIDDNIINRANREGSTEPEVAAEWKAVYDEAIKANNRDARAKRATERAAAR